MKHALLFSALLITLLASAQPNAQWVRTAGGSYPNEAYRSAADAAGHLYTAGCGTAMDFGNGVTVPNQGWVIARYDSLGVIDWARAVSTTENELYCVSGIDVNSEGDLWITGYFYSATLTLDAIVLTGPLLATSSFLARLDSEGNVEFATNWGTVILDETLANDLHVDAADHVLVTGSTNADSLSLGALTIPNPGLAEQLFVLKFDAAGTPLWGNISDAPNGNSIGWCVGTDAMGNTYVTGLTTGQFIMDEDTVDAGDTDVPTHAVLIKLDESGVVSHMNVIAQCYPVDMTVDDAGNAYVCGVFEVPISFGTDVLENSAQDGFVVAYDPEGDYHWVIGVQGDVDNELCRSVVLDDSQEALILSGTFDNAAWFADDVYVTGSNEKDGFVMRMDTTGEVDWVKLMTSDGPTLFAEAHLDPWDNLYASGVTQADTTYLGFPVLNGSGNHAFLTRFDELGVALPSVAQRDDELYPNPCSGTFSIVLPADARTVTIEDAQGRVVARERAMGSQRSTFRLDAPGVYFVSVLTTHGREVRRVVVEL